MSFIRNFFLCFATFLVITHRVVAQNVNEKPTMADAMRSNGKIYVVVAVVLTIFVGLIVYLWRLDKKINKLEKNNK